MQKIAGENNLSETAFAVKEANKGPHDEDVYHLRWITPKGEIDLCGHATLATAFVISKFYGALKKDDSQNSQLLIFFSTRSGLLTVRCSDDLYELDFPSFSLQKTECSQLIIDALGVEPEEVHLGRDLVCILKDDNTVRTLNPDIQRIATLPGTLCHATARSTTDEFDCVSRSFAPKHGITEDPVCGSGHCHIAPYWSNRLKKPRIVGCQASKRGGTLFCDCSQPNRVKLSGKAVLFSTCEIHC